MHRKRGERNWEEVAGDYELHVPATRTPGDDLEHQTIQSQSIIWIHGTPYIRAADGKLDPMDQ